MTQRSPRVLVAYPSVYLPATPQPVDEIKSSPWVLASYLSRHFDTTYADFEKAICRPSSPIQTRRFERRVREYFENNHFDVIALSCWTSLSYKSTWEVARIARQVHPHAMIVVGGYHPSARPQDFTGADRVFDYVIRGEGEIALRQLSEGFATVGRPAQTTIVDSPALPANQLAPVDFHLIDDLLAAEHGGQFGTLTFFLSRGCPFHCTFCVESLKESTWRPFTPEEGIRQIREALDRYSVQALGIGDACFGAQPAWRKKFLRLLKELNPRVWVMFETRPEYLDQEDIELLAGLNIEIQFGLESCSPTMLRIMNKTKQPEKFIRDFIELSHRLSDHDIVHGANLIFNHPGETEQTLRETFTVMDEELKRQNTALMFVGHGYLHFPGSTLDRDRTSFEEKYGSVFLNDEWWKSDEDPYVSARRIVPSGDLNGERVDLWKKWWQEREEARRATLSPRAFKMAAESYFSEWQSDERYIPD